MFNKKFTIALVSVWQECLLCIRFLGAEYSKKTGVQRGRSPLASGKCSHFLCLHHHSRTDTTQTKNIGTVPRKENADMKEHNYPQYVKRKDINLHIKLDQTTKDELDRLCTKTGLTKSEIIRRSIHIMCRKNSNSNMVTTDFLKRNGQTLKAMDSLNARLNAIQLDYRKIGVNLNQITKKLHMGELDGLQVVQAVNESIEGDIEKIRQSVSTLVKWLYT